MSNKIDLTGKPFERWTVVCEAGRDSRGEVLWFCQCVCGTEKIIRGGVLRSGESRSCGCLQREKLITHGLSKHPLYNVWYSILIRCYQTYNPRYKDYGGRGISVCSDWHHNFTAFYHWGLSNGWKKGLSLDRIENDGNYEPGNCQFIPLGLNSVKQRVLNSRNTSGYKGVSWNKVMQKYYAQIVISGKTTYLGLFDSPKLAALVYDKVARHVGDNRSLNFG